MGVAVLDNSGFISKIIQDVDTGFCFTPLIGSGLSSPSGIIMGMEFTNYLAFATYLVLSDPRTRPKTHGEGRPGPWDLSHQGWPPLPSNQEVELAKKWVLEEFKELCGRFDLELNYEEHTHQIKSLSRRGGASLTPGILSSLVYPRVPTILASHQLEQTEERVRRVAEVLIRQAGGTHTTTASAIDFVISDPMRSYRQRLVEMGIRALHDWRETLVILSSVEIDGHASGRESLTHGRQKQSVIDRFNSFITRDKRPNLGHKMLAHLSGPMRFRSLLTTNFDTLTEDAFQALNLNLRVLPVSSRGHLPEPQAVGAECTLVKLHGEMHDTRADTSLDDEPSDDDKQTFMDYLTRGAGNICRELSPRESHRLLVIGYSGSDQRCVQMIRHWLEKSADQPILYWICFSDPDVARVKRLFAASEYNHCVRVTRCNRPDLLLHELYQRLVLSMPPGGLTYELAHVVPPVRAREFDNDPTLVNNALDCAETVEHPLEASRVLLSETAKLDDARRLSRDANVLALKQLILDAIEGKLNFYDANGRYVPCVSKASRASEPKLRVAVADLWRPRYRDSKNRDPAQGGDPNKGDDDALFEPLQSRPILIDALGGVVRAVGQAVDDLSRRSPRKIFWIETQDYVDADSLLNDLLRSLAVRFGAFQSRQVTQHPLDIALREIEKSSGRDSEYELQSGILAAHIKDALLDYRVDASNIVVLLYGRDSYGSCAGLTPSPWGALSPEAERADAFKPLHCIIEALGRTGIQVIYFPLARGRAEIKNRLPADPAHPESIWEFGDGNGAAAPPAGQRPGGDRPVGADWGDWKGQVDQWMSWPHDPFCGAWPRWMVGEGREDEPLVDHFSNRSNSVFRSIIEEVMRPYFEFADRSARPRDRRYYTDSEIRKIKFLYAITLFRHSRHVNALCSEAVFHCPNRFNESAIDNDFLRTDEIARWIKELRDSRVFFNKAGGSAWMHRDVQLTLQHFIERIQLKGGDHSKSGNGSLREVRARIHFWIGDWYQKAFCSSGYLLPIIESVHHRLMAAIYSPFASYKRTTAEDLNPAESRKHRSQLLQYRTLLYESSILEAHKSLLISWRALKLWQANPIEVAWVGAQHRHQIRERLSRTVAKLISDETQPDAKLRAATEDRLRSVTEEFLDCLEALSEELSLEAGGRTKNASSRRSPVNDSLFARRRAKSTANCEPIVMDHSWDIVNRTERAFDDHVCGVFGSSGGEELLRSIKDISQVAGAPRAIRVAALSSKKAAWKNNHAQDPRKLHDMIWLLGEYAYLILRRAKLRYHSTGAIQFDDWIKATVACNLGVDFCKHLPPWMLQFDIHSKVKLHSLYGVSLANLGRAFESHRHFNEALALLSKMPNSSPADVAILNLRRAESLITECFWIGLFLEGEPGYPEKTSKSDPENRTVEDNAGVFGPRLGVDRLYLVDDQPDGDGAWSSELIEAILQKRTPERVIFVPPKITECIRKSSEDNRRQTLMRLYSSVLDEAVVLLDQAERNLSGNSQAGLWWSRLYTLRLRIFGLLDPLGSHAGESLILRKYSADQGIFQSFHQSLRISEGDHFRRFRTLKYFFEADRWLRRFVSRNEDSVSLLPDSHARARKALKALIHDLQLDEKRTYDPQQQPLQAATMKLHGDFPDRNGKRG